MKDINTEDLIGTTIGVFNDQGKIIKDITITKATNTKNGLIVFDEEGTPYHEDELNWSYRLTPEYILYNTLESFNINMPEWNQDLMKDIFNTFMDKMVLAGYIGEKE